MTIAMLFRPVETSEPISTMIDQQKQEVGSGSNAIQAKGDVIVHQGATPEQMSQIIGAISKQLSSFAAEARTVADQRCEEFREEILAEFAKPETRAYSEAFKDPDYQYLIGKSLGEYARKGTDELKSELIEMLVERSKEETGSRISLILNSAIEAVPKLSKQDKDILVTLFVIKNVRINSSHMSGIYPNYVSMLSGHVDGLPTGTVAFEYLQAIGCIAIERVADHYPLPANFFRQYGQIANAQKSFVTLSNNAKNASYTEASLWNEFIENVPELAAVDSVWQSSFYRHSTPTATGRAVAHAVLKGEKKLTAGIEAFFS